MRDYLYFVDCKEDISHDGIQLVQSNSHDALQSYFYSTQE